MNDFAKTYKLTDYHLAAFEALVHHPGTNHTGKVMDELRKKGLVYVDLKDGGYHAWSHIEEEFRQSTRSSKSHG